MKQISFGYVAFEQYITQLHVTLSFAAVHLLAGGVLRKFLEKRAKIEE